MNYKGLGPGKWKYKINCPISDEEKKEKLTLDKKVSKEITDDLSVIRINSTYLELVDRWYADKGHAVLYGLIGGSGSLFCVSLFIYYFVKADYDPIGYSITGFFMAIMIGILISFLYLIHFEAFRYTHYPIRFNRKNRMIYAFRPNGTILQVPWDKIFICRGKHPVPLMGRDFYDIRAHILDDDGITIRETFTLGYPIMGDRKRLDTLWEYIRRYMEEDDGVEQAYNTTNICMPVCERKEGWKFCIMRGFQPGAFSPLIAQTLFSPLWAVITWGRLISIYTSKIPYWPKEIDGECKVEDNDPYRKDWKDNGEYTFYEEKWPIIWFFIGSGIALVCIFIIIYFMSIMMD